MTLVLIEEMVCLDIPEVSVPHPEAPVQHQPKPRSTVLRLAPWHSSEAATARWAAR